MGNDSNGHGEDDFYRRKGNEKFRRPQFGERWEDRKTGLVAYVELGVVPVGKVVVIAATDAGSEKIALSHEEFHRRFYMPEGGRESRVIVPKTHAEDAEQKRMQEKLLRRIARSTRRTAIASERAARAAELSAAMSIAAANGVLDAKSLLETIEKLFPSLDLHGLGIGGK